MRIKRLIAAALCCMLLAGCSDMSLTGSDVLTPPQAHGAQSELQALLRERTGGAYTLVYPSTGEIQSAVISRDTDGDGADEAIALYRDRDDVIHILSLYSEQSDYTVSGEAKLQTAQIDRVDFADLDGDGREECLVAYPDSASGLFSLTVIRPGSAYAQADLPAACSRCLIVDSFDKAGQSLLLFSLPSPVASACVRLADYQDGALSVKASCEMDSLLTGYEKITFGKVSRDVSGVFVDGRTASGDYTTQVIYYDPDAGLLNPLFLYAGYESTRRINPILSDDIDGDSLIELPICSLFDFEEKENADDVCCRITWNNYDPAAPSLVTKKTAVLCEDAGYLFNISDNRVGAVTARRGGEGCVQIYAWEYRDGAMRRTDLLLTLNRCSKDSYPGFGIGDMILTESDGAVFTYTIGETDNRLGYTDEEVRESFVLPGQAGA